LLVVDEAYMEFTDGEASAIPIARDADDVVVLRTFSKTYDMTRERATYAIGAPRIVQAIDVPDATPVARVAAAGMLGHTQLSALRADVAERRGILTEILSSFGASFWPGELMFEGLSVTNFVMAQLPRGRLYDVLRARNIKTLPLDREPGIESRGYCRIAVPSYADLDRLADRLKR